MSTIKVPSIGHYVAQIPFTIGHHLTDDHVVVGFFGTDKRAIAHGAFQWEDGIDTRGVVASFRRNMQDAEPVAHVFVVGYGPHGNDRAELLAEQIEDALEVASTPVQVLDGTWRSVEDPAGPWSSALPIPQASPDMVGLGMRAPAASREELFASVAPLPEPLFGPLDRAKAKYLTTVSPATRADLAVAALDHIAAGRIDDPAHLQSLAHLVTTDVTVRDAVLASALDGGPRHDRVEALVRTYRAAPAEQRPMLATTAAAAAFLAAWHPPLVWGVLQHADPASRLTSLITGALRAGANPAPMRPGLLEAVRDGLRQAEDAWTASHVTADHANPATSSGSRVVRPAVPAPPHPRPSTGADAPGL